MSRGARHLAWGLVLTLGAWGGATRADSAAARNNQGNHLYEEKRYDEALKMYTDAQATRPESPELHYNIGNVLFRKGEFDKAAEEYQRAQTASDPMLSQAAVFNRGNALMMQGRLQDAINSYVQALRSRPDDQDAKRNLELALRLLEEQRKEQQQQQDGKPPQDGDKQKQEQERPQPNPSGDQKQDPDRPQPRQAGEMTEEEARRILDALKEEEREGIRKHAQAAIPQTREPEKDW